ncbi:MAG: hypothetical protein NVSMB52_06770 [Chloroflexota bacterium]
MRTAPSRRLGCFLSCAAGPGTSPAASSGRRALSLTAISGFHGGLAAIGSLALHPPGPACLSAPGAAKGGLVVTTPTTFFWTPQASQTASAPTVDPLDPRALRLLPQDFPSGYLFPAGSHDYQGQYVNLCGSLPALGRHRAYLAQFGYAGVRASNM